MEHSSFTIGDLADMVAWLKATPVAPFVRIPETQYHFVARALDVGALGIVAPNVQTAAQARKLVAAAKYPPLGKRGLHSGGASSDFRKVVASEYSEFSNKNTSVIPLIESPEGVANVEQIAKVPGIDGLWVGYADLSQYMGIAGQYDNPRFLDAMKRVAEAARDHDLPAIIQPGSPAQLQEWTALGFNVISYGSDFALYREALARGVAEVRRALGDS
jgi:2-dehydro-3-deoxyglucarate aldolase/4-hydroxy-2-oxoheptanedioate aldolase